ncbi:PhzF family phenazine biosynthesis protein [Adhaeribacter arboris]|uniref:PhzF family phenazine biosynthesis protein n=1 Tax=Adhaeribacter arboris TaxID=2072846 RepID=A0A2T2YBD8_9BACT|nr:PhzF family phenazine biosynthesis protein [Adhaeribacter arboris]PSR52758.1 PhzF family phenazine biosynthesis protein [Adhaeribacter arboris]
MDLMQAVEVQIINAFVDQEQGGNPAGVVLNADALTSAQKQAIAQIAGLNETAFVAHSELADFKLDFFTPTRQIAHCGHATIATFSYLAQTHQIKSKFSSKETIDGRREIILRGDLAFMEQKAPQYTEVTSYQNQILKSIGLTEQDLIHQAPLLRVNTGNSFIIIPVKNAAVLQNLQPDFTLIAQLSDALDLVGFYVFSTETGNVRDVHTRMFAPRYGIPEEAATGMAAGPLACYLFDIMQVHKTQFLIQQGYFMAKPSPSLIIVDLRLKENKIQGLMAGGKGIPVKKIKIEI